MLLIHDKSSNKIIDKLLGVGKLRFGRLWRETLNNDLIT
jgi:hypothetical protein